MDRLSKRLYMRPLSGVIRKFHSAKSVERMQENPVVHVEGPNRIILVTICRIRQRLLSQAWERLVHNTGVKHDWEADARIILSRRLPSDELRTELEIEVLYRWIISTKDIDPTGIANTIYMCKKRSAVYTALQQLRLEFFDHGETVLIQGDIPSAEDGHFTILNGECEVLQFPEDSMPLMRLVYLAKKKKWDEVKKLLKQARVLAKIPKHSGFGELSTLTGVKRAASIRTCRKPGTVTEIIVLPKQPLLDCLRSRRGDDVQGAAPSEAMDFMRQSGLANRISPKDLVMAAKSMIRRTLMRGDILYYKGDPVQSMFLVVSGEFLLDTSDYMHDGVAEPFTHSLPESCFHLSSGSILGDEGATGQTHCYASTAACVSDAAVVFEAVGFGFNFLTQKIGALRYCALTYKDRSRWSAPLQLAEEINPYTYFNSLRKAIAYTSPFRGARDDIYLEVDDNYYDEELGVDADARAAATRLAGVMGKGDSRMLQGASDIGGKKKDKKGKLMQGKSAKSKMQQSVRDASRTQNPKAKMAKTLRNMQGNVSFLLNNNSGPRKTSSVDLSHTSIAAGDDIFGDQHRHKLTDEDMEMGKIYELSAVGLHRALDVNKLAKKLMERNLKIHAKENILFEQMVKELQEVDPDGAYNSSAERTFKKYIAEYRQRSEQKTKEYLAKLAEEKRRAMLASESKSALRFFSTLTGEALELSDDEEDPGIAVTNEDSASRLGTPMAAAISLHHSAPLSEAVPADPSKQGEKRLSINAAAEMTPNAPQATPTPHHAYETPEFFQKPRIVQYFIWMDHLNRHTYRMLVSQAQQTVDFNRMEQHNINQPEGLANQAHVTEESMKELAELFHRYGLTPADMNLAYKAGSRRDGTPARRIHGSLDDDSDEDEHLLHNRNSTSRAAATPVPTLSLPSTAGDNALNAHSHSTTTGTVHFAVEDDKQRRSLMVSLETKESVEDRRRNARLASTFKTYTPASWRDDMIKKSEMGLMEKANSMFYRLTTSDNRRVNVTHYQYPGHHHPDYEQDHHYHKHLNRTHSFHYTAAGQRRKSSTMARRGTVFPNLPPGEIQLENAKRDIRDHIEDLDSEMERIQLEWEEEMERIEELQQTFDSDPQSFMDAVAQVAFPVRKQFLPAYTWNTRYMKLQGEVNMDVVQKEAILVHNPKTSSSAQAEKAYSKAALLQNAKSIQEENIEIMKAQDQKVVDKAVLDAVLNSRSFISFAMRGSAYGGEAVSMSDPASAAAARSLLARAVDGGVSNARSTDAVTLRPGSALHALPSHIAPAPATEEDATAAKLEGNSLSTAGATSSGNVGLLQEQSTSSSPKHEVIIESQRQSVVSPVVPPPHLAQESVDSDLIPVSTMGGVKEEREGSERKRISLNLGDDMQQSSTDGEDASRRYRNGDVGGGSQVSAFQLAADAAIAAVEASTSTVAVTAAVVSPSKRSPAGSMSSPGKKRSMKGSFSNAMASGDATIQRINDLKHRLMTEKPDSVALEIYQSFVNTDMNPKPFFEGKRRTNAGSKFKLLQELRGTVLDVQKASEEEIKLIGATSDSAVMEKEVALFNSVFPNASEKQRRAFATRIRRRLQGKDDESTSQGDEEQSSVWTDDSFSYGFNVKAKESEKFRSQEKQRQEEVELAARERAKLEARALMNSSESIAHSDPELAEWQEFTLRKMQREQRGAKKTLPVLIIKREGGSNSRRYTVNKSKRWGGGTLVTLPSQQEQEPIRGPSSYLDIYKSKPQVRTSVKDRQRILDELKNRAKSAEAK